MCNKSTKRRYSLSHHKAARNYVRHNSDFIDGFLLVQDMKRNPQNYELLSDDEAEAFIASLNEDVANYESRVH